MAWIEGFDVSHWNGEGCVGKICDQYPEMKFCIIKLTEGITYNDRNAVANAVDADINRNLEVGFYHYARGGANTPEAEATHFVSALKEIITEHMAHMPFIVLDWEGDALKSGQDWALAWCKEVERLTGCKPMVYCSASVVKTLTKLEAGDYGLWVANRTGAMPSITPWKTVAMWQYTSSPFDRDRFNGTVEQLRKYFVPYAFVKDHDPDDDGNSGYGHCGCCCCDKE